MFLYHITEANLEQNLLSVEHVARNENDKVYNILMQHQKQKDCFVILQPFNIKSNL
jgi:hypothetical protein